MKTKEKIIVAILVLIIIAIAVGCVSLILLKIKQAGDIISGDYYTKVSFHPAKFLGNGVYGPSRKRSEPSFYSQFEFKENGKTINLETGISNTHSGEPDVVLAVINRYTNNSNLMIDSVYTCYPHENVFVGRLGNLIEDSTFYIYDYKDKLTLKTDILEGYKYERRDEYSYGSINVDVFANSENKRENGISSFLTSGEEETILNKVVFKKIDSYETEYGTLYILKRTAVKENRLNYIGVLKYGDLENQEIIFEVYNVGVDDIVNTFKSDIVKEKVGE